MTPKPNNEWKNNQAEILCGKPTIFLDRKKGVCSITRPCKKHETQEEIMSYIYSLLSSERQRLREKIENAKELHTHNSIPSFTADIKEGCIICLKNQTIENILKLLED